MVMGRVEVTMTDYANRAHRYGCMTHCKEGTYTIMVNGQDYTFELVDISTKDAGYGYFEVRFNREKIGNHQCQGDDCERTIRMKLRKWLRKCGS